MSKTKIAIVGLGLMGGSLSLALQEKSKNNYYIGVDNNEENCAKALEKGIVNEIVSDLKYLEDCEIIFLTVPVDAIVAISKKMTFLKEKTTVIDFGSTKEKISNSIPKEIRKNFITAHPMTGTEKSGPENSIVDLYKNKTVVICDVEKSGFSQKEKAEKIFNLLNMSIVYMASKEHDIHAAYISHMPHAVSYALANSVINHEDNKSIVSLAGGGFKDMSRIAKSSPQMWEDIFRQNKIELVNSISVFQQELQKCKEMVEREDWEGLNKWMQQANSLHDILK